MNIDRGKTSFTEEEIEALRAQLSQYKTYEGFSWDTLGKRVGVPGGTLSTWVPGKYAGDNSAIAWRVNKFFIAEEQRQQLELQAPIVPGFQMTATARRIHSQLRWAQRGKFVLIVGTAGVGKTAAIDQYRETTPNVFKATMAPHAASVSAMLVELLNAVGVARNGGTRQTLFHIICDRLDGLQGLIVIDEAQHLDDTSLEELRAIHDRTKVGIALCGNPRVLTRIQGGARNAAFAQLYSRVSFPHQYDKPDDADVEVILNAWGVTHPKEREFLGKIAALPGCIRSVTMTLELATLTAQGEDEDRTLEHIKSAWSQHARQPFSA